MRLTLAPPGNAREGRSRPYNPTATNSSKNKKSGQSTERRKIVMRYALLISTALLVALGHGQPAAAQTAPLDLVKQGIEAEGGVDALRAIKSLTLKGAAKHWEPG